MKKIEEIEKFLSCLELDKIKNIIYSDKELYEKLKNWIPKITDISILIEDRDNIEGLRHRYDNIDDSALNIIDMINTRINKEKLDAIKELNKLDESKN